MKPFLVDGLRGRFSTRYPCRFKPIGFSIIRITGREGKILHLEGADMVDGIPMLDIKPYFLNLTFAGEPNRLVGSPRALISKSLSGGD